MEKTREVSSKKTGDNKGTFHPKQSTIKGRNGNKLREAEEIKEEVSRIY